MKRTVKQVTLLTSPNGTKMLPVRINNQERLGEFTANMQRRGYLVVDVKNVKAGKYEISWEEYEAGKRPDTFEY
jgi:hypothetical protein